MGKNKACCVECKGGGARTPCLAARFVGAEWGQRGVWGRDAGEVELNWEGKKSRKRSGTKGPNLSGVKEGEF